MEIFEFRNDMIEARERAKDRRSKYRKKNGGIRMGLNLLLQIPEVAYPDADDAGRGSPANALKDVRDHFAHKSPHIDSLTSTVNGKWRRMLTYLEHDVREMDHLFGFMAEQEMGWDERKAAQGRRRG